MLRGFALVCIMLDHMPIGVARNATISNFFLFDAAELFVLLSGFLVGLVWRQVAARDGTGAAQRRFAIRAFQVWRAMMVAAVLMALLSLGLQALDLTHTAVWNGYAEMLATQPLQYLLAVGSLWMQPNLLDVLALYALVLAFVPLVLPGIMRWPLLTAAVLFAVWWYAVPLNNLLPNERPGARGLLFNPFGWQALFFTGAALGVYRTAVMARLRPIAPLVTLLAVCTLIFGALVLIGWRVGQPLQPLRDALFAVHGVIDKWPMDGARYLSILAAAWLVAAPLAGLFGWLAGTGPGRALATIGRGGLVSFVACVLLSVLGDAGQNAIVPAAAARLLVDLWTIPALWVIAEVLARWDARPSRTALPVRVRGATPVPAPRLELRHQPAQGPRQGRGPGQLA
ncbi:OpgC domain-containing protein [Paracoccus suum]|uniref:OpgC domain-containing protein n=2 Tax=Paracoccus suum TaxID=2259340 RepID=A0A344PHH2_9RHOB|nr:OpgC domain-containing protein [Paracoccus suum]